MAKRSRTYWIQLCYADDRPDEWLASVSSRASPKRQPCKDSRSARVASAGFTQSTAHSVTWGRSSLMGRRRQVFSSTLGHALPQHLGQPGQGMRPIARALLPPQRDARVPGGGGRVLSPAPVTRQRQQHLRRQAE